MGEAKKVGMFGGKNMETFQAAGRRDGQRGSKFQGSQSFLLGTEKNGCAGGLSFRCKISLGDERFQTETREI